MSDDPTDEDGACPLVDVDPTLMADPPSTHPYSTRALEIIAAGRRLLEGKGPNALTMRNLGVELGIQAPSLYKHLPGKRSLEWALVDVGASEIGRALRDAVRDPRPHGPIASVLAAYRDYARAHPNLYRLATSSRTPFGVLTSALGKWTGDPFLLVTGDPHVAQALFSFAHGTVILELDGRLPADRDLQRTWDAGADAFTAACRVRSGASLPANPVSPVNLGRPETTP